ncbi:hypothetical protein BV25DRAFT_1830419 [Artomyces pyxidatus]|uniref:Uncharacterized protein n=1 Tax=Artomyces pyxidatus TaxID=48021 RepID=A0ACB8SNL1_9AGAM|nr:hypothetical protein BV25DRAFT_1830419 [Artomyces pyxidatus]
MQPSQWPPRFQPAGAPAYILVSGPAPAPSFAPAPPPEPIALPSALLQLPPAYNEMMTLIQDARTMHLATLEQHREIERYTTDLGEWLGEEAHFERAQVREVGTRVDQLKEEWERVKQRVRDAGEAQQAQPAVFPPPPGAFQQRGTVYSDDLYSSELSTSPVIPGADYRRRTPSTSESPVIPSPILRRF